MTDVVPLLILIYFANLVTGSDIKKVT